MKGWVTGNGLDSPTLLVGLAAVLLIAAALGVMFATRAQRRGSARGSARPFASGSVARPRRLELTRLRGHCSPMGGGVHDAEEPTAVPARVPAADHRAGAQGPHALNRSRSSSSRPPRPSATGWPRPIATRGSARMASRPTSARPVAPGCYKPTLLPGAISPNAPSSDGSSNGLG
jgi:hypothetical protein